LWAFTGGAAFAIDGVVDAGAMVMVSPAPGDAVASGGWMPLNIAVSMPIATTAQAASAAITTLIGLRLLTVVCRAVVLIVIPFQ
jgi:hypothetical protein